MAEDEGKEPQRDPRWNRLSLLIMGAGGASLLAAVILFVLILTGSVGETGYSGPETNPGFRVDPTAVYAQPTSAAPPSEAPIARIVIPKFEVNAPIVVRGVDAQGIMQTPAGPEDVAWYDFSARPGFGSNAVFSGHVDYRNYGPAVFWNLKDLVLNDVIEVQLQDGTVYRYSVFERKQVVAATAPVGEIVGPTENEVITLITCGGTFDPSVGQYDQRVIVRAARFIGDVPPGAPAGASSSIP